jgi:hypothetical protein
LIGWDIQGCQCCSGDSKISSAAGAVYDRTGGYHDPSRLSYYLHRFSGRSPGCDHVFDNIRLFARLNFESSSEPENAFLPLGKDASHAKRSGCFMRNQNSAQGRRNYQVSHWGQLFHSSGKR